MLDSAENKSLEATLFEDWQSLKEIAVVSNLKPGNENWFDLAATFGLPATVIFPMRVAVAPGSAWNRQFECFSLEIIRVVPHLDYPELKPPDCSRARVFHYDQPVTFDMLKPISPLVPNRPCIEQVRIEDKLFIDIRGVHNIESTRWSEEIIALLTGAWLITRDNNLLTDGELRYELKIISTIDAMAERGHERSSPPRFTVTAFAAEWLRGMSRTNIYNIIPDHRWGEITERYNRRWEEKHKEYEVSSPTSKHRESVRSVKK